MNAAVRAFRKAAALERADLTAYERPAVESASAVDKCSENARTLAAQRRSGGLTRFMGKGLGSQPGSRTCASPLAIRS